MVLYWFMVLYWYWYLYIKDFSPHLPFVLSISTPSFILTGNISSMIAVNCLGEGIGYSLCQSSMVIAGLWGMFYFGEIERKVGWLSFMFVTLGGILVLSYEHE